MWSETPEVGEHLRVFNSPWSLLYLELLVPTLKEVGGTERATWSTQGQVDWGHRRGSAPENKHPKAG